MQIAKTYKPVFFIYLILFSLTAIAQDSEYLEVIAKNGDGFITLLSRYNLESTKKEVNKVKEINGLKPQQELLKDRSYKIPVLIYAYNGKSIRSTIGIIDWDLAIKIQEYNEKMLQKGLKPKDYRTNGVLWVPESWTFMTQTNEEAVRSNSKVVNYQIFGKEHENIEIKSDELKGQAYYIVAGHGGPDPGAIGKYKGHSLCEDEYAYDIALRLARSLIENSATVYIIIRDNNDGIRSGEILKHDKEETCRGNKKIPLNQMKRLKQRTEVINNLYKENKKRGFTTQRAIFLHLDSRSSKQRIDMFFYHSPKSKGGKKLATQLRNTIDEKYSQHQKNRGYSGTVEARNLYVLRKTYPVAVFIELGNIKNSKDQKRFILEDNRQAVAKWLCDGLLKSIY